MKSVTSITAIVLLGCVNNVYAESDSQLAYAKVISVKPITRSVHIPNQHHECWDEVSSYRDEGDNGVASSIVGGIVGGVVGHQIGKGHGKTAATIAGSVLGATVGRNLQNSNGHADLRRRCRVIDNGYDEETIDGYRVTYRYNGKKYHTRTSYPPGNTLRVRVTTIVDPIVSN